VGAALELEPPPKVTQAMDWHIAFACPCCRLSCYFGKSRINARETVAHPEPSCVLYRQFSARDFMRVVKQRAGAAWPL
jgi:hypothetical protein